MTDLTDAAYEKFVEKYGGKFIATKSFNSIDVITSGENIKDVHDDATKNYNISDPVISYVPKKGEQFAFSLN
jgi:hypothetical protein